MNPTLRHDTATTTELGDALLAMDPVSAGDTGEIDASRAWRPMSLRQLRSGYVIVVRPQHQVPGHDDSSYWCGHADFDSFVNWLHYRDPLTGKLTAAPVAVYTTHLDAAFAWSDFLAERRARGLPVEDRVVEIVALANIPDLAQVPGPGPH
jgi:hypothetical protein